MNDFFVYLFTTLSCSISLWLDGFHFVLFFFNQGYVQPKLKYFALFELDANQN